jgi:hypothetical protein
LGLGKLQELGPELGPEQGQELVLVPVLVLVPGPTQ